MTTVAVSVWDPLTIRGVTFQNRIGASPMCMYSSVDGFVAEPFHSTHVGCRVQGLGLFMVEATAVEAVGRITPACLGIYKDEHIAGHKRLVDYIHSTSECKIGIQLAHSGTKGSHSPYHSFRQKANIPLSEENGGWLSSVRNPSTMSIDDIEQLIRITYPNAVKRSIKAGYDFIELHFAHGYLVHSFYSLITNDQRRDKYGGKSIANRCRFAVEVAANVRRLFGGPLFVRLSCEDYLAADAFPNRWTMEDTLYLVSRLKTVAGVDVIDCSGGGINRHADMFSREPMFQVHFADTIKKSIISGVRTAAVGNIREYTDAESIIATQKSDFVLLGRKLLADPYLVLKWQKKCKRFRDYVPQYGYAVEYRMHRGTAAEQQRKKREMNNSKL